MESLVLDVPTTPRTRDVLQSLQGQLPLALYLSPRIPKLRAAVLQELILREPRLAWISDSEDGALHVLPDFELEELAALERRKKRVVGLPFVERFLKTPEVLNKVPALPLFDLIYNSPGAICCSGLAQDARIRCSALARWVGAKFAEDLGPEVSLLVTARVSLHPDSKYQAALKGRLPIVRSSYFEAMWQAKHEVKMEPHLLPTLAGLAICFEPGEVKELCQRQAVAHGAVSTSLDKAEIVIVTDVSRTLYREARKIGLLAAPPLWLERCLQLRRCMPIAGELEVPQPGAVSSGSPAHVESNSGTTLMSCVLCLLYIEPGRQRDTAKALAWRCGALSTLDPADKAITHVLFHALPNTLVYVSVPVDEDRVSFLDVSWLEACLSKKARESAFTKQRVAYNPSCDTAHAAALGRSCSRGLGRTLSTTLDEAGTLKRRGSETGLIPIMPPPQPVGGAVEPGLSADATAGGAVGPADTVAATTVKPTVPTGVFAGLVLGLVGWPTFLEAEEQALVQLICSHGGTAVHVLPVCSAPFRSVLSEKLDVCVCHGNGQPPFQASEWSSVALATAHWVQACVADTILHPRSSFPHFEPGRGPFPLSNMSECTVRITALDSSRESHRQRARLEELIQALGAKVAQQTTRWSETTHVVCVLPALTDSRLAESARKRQIPLVSAQWLFACFNSSGRQPEEQYSVKVDGSQAADGRDYFFNPESAEGATGGVAALLTSFAATVLANHHICISTSALGSHPKLPQMADELGAARVDTWRSVAELRALLEESTTKNPLGQMVALLDKEQVCGVDEELASFLDALNPESRSIFVLPSWLSETYSQRRRLPLDSFAALPAAGVETQTSPKKPRLEAPEALYAWQPAESKRLEQLSEEARAREMQSKAQQKVNEGLRLAELRREPSRS